MAILSKCVVCDRGIPVIAGRRGPKRLYCDDHRGALAPKQREGIARMRRVSSATEVRATAAAMVKARLLEPGLSDALLLIQREIKSAGARRAATGRRTMSLQEHTLMKVRDKILKRLELTRQFPDRSQI